MKLYLIMAWRNVWRNKKRTWITASSIAFAVFFAVVMQSMQLGSYERMIDNSVRFYTGHLAVHQEEYWDDKVLDNSYLIEEIANLQLNDDQVAVSVPRLSSFALASYENHTKGVMINGIDPEKEAQLTLLDKKVTQGAYLKDEGIMIAEGLAEYMGMQLGDTLVLISQGYHGVNAVGKYHVVGFLKFPVPEFNQTAVYMPLATAQVFYGAPEMITSQSILLLQVKDMVEVQQSVQQQMEGSNLTVMNWEEMMPELIQSIEMDYYGGLMMIYILYAVIGFGILGTFLMMTKERTYEFGILNSIGMKRSKIQVTVALEIIFLTFVGVAVGLLASTPLVIYFYHNPIYFTGDYAKAFESFGYEAIMPFSMDPVIFYNQAIVVLLISLLLGIYPMMYIKRLKIIKALKE
ncbi:MAG: FtsX-like permease family protein [Cytophagales bacterium]|nr:FtsX-like permease family protein [Cytophagales bacterium]